MFSFNQALTPASARNAALVNQLATPGLGTLMLGKYALGFAQLGLALAGFALVIGWFGAILIQYYGQISGDVKPHSIAWIGIVGALLFISAWVWSLFTSIALMRRAQREASSPAVPPVISP